MVGAAFFFFVPLLVAGGAVSGFPENTEMKCLVIDTLQQLKFKRAHGHRSIHIHRGRSNDSFSSNFVFFLTNISYIQIIYSEHIKQKNLAPPLSLQFLHFNC